jgi:amino acid transporter
MMNSIPVIAITVGVILVLLLGVMLFVRIKYKQPFQPDYRAFFLLGLIWIMIGIINLIQDGSAALGALGVILLAIGLGNRDKWRQQKKWADLPPELRRMKLIFVLVILLVLVLGIAAFFWLRMQG